MNDENNQIKLEHLKAKHLGQVAKLHIESINAGFVSSLGEQFVAFLYEGIIGSDQAYGFVAVEDSTVVGFISCVEKISVVYKYILRKHSFKLIKAILPKFFFLSNLKNIIETLLYPTRSRGKLPSTEILAIAVDYQSRTSGIGRRLVKQALSECRNRGIKSIRVMVGDPLPANEFYKHLGFRLVDQYCHHGHLANVYVMDIGEHEED